MSKARQSDENAGSPDPLRALFQKLAEGVESHSAREVWQTMLRDRWLQADVKRRAMLFVLASHMPEHLADDLAQEALVMFLDKLKADPSLHAKAESLPKKFEAWIGTMLKHSISDAAEKLCPKRPPHVTLTDDAKSVERDVTLDERDRMVAEALARLKGKERSAILLDLDGVKHTIIAKKLHMTYKEVIGALKRARSKLRKWLAEYRYDK